MLGQQYTSGEERKRQKGLKRSPLKRKTPISKKGRKTKGDRGEREVKDILLAHGFDACDRNVAQRTRGGSDMIGVEGYGIEVKFHEVTKPWEWYEQAVEMARPTETPVVAFRRSRSQWMALISFEDLLGLMEAERL